MAMCTDALNSGDGAFESPSIQIENIRYRATEYKYGFWPCGKSQILQVSGHFAGGKLTAIIGESGNGKTSLMDVVSGYRCRGVSGQIFVDGKERNPSSLIKLTCYVRQDTVLQPLLTAYEAMMFVANVKMGSKIPLEQKRSIVSEILRKLILLDVKNTLTKNLSGGQEKRLALALELISNPLIIILDEPTSGLDSLTSRECVKILRDMSNEGRTIICSIHQPSMSLLQLFDNLYIMWRGRCMYQGAVDSLVAFLMANNLVCPIHYNPVEFVLELCILDNENNADALIKAIDNGRSVDWMTSSSFSTRDKGVLVHRPKASSGKTHDKNILNNSNNRNRTRMYKTSTPFYYQLYYVLQRKLLITSRDLLLFWLMILANIGEGVGMGIFYYNKGNDAQWVIFNYNIIFFLSLAALFNGLLSRIIAFPAELQIVKREYFNQWYSLKVYWISSTVVDNPIVIVTISLACGIFYYMVGYPLESFRVAQFIGIMIALAGLSQDYGLLIGTIFSMQHGLVFGIVSGMILLTFSGFIFYSRDCTYELCRQMFHLSPLKRVFQEALISVYGYDREPLKCEKIFCPYTYPSVFIEEVDMKAANGEMFWSSLTFILVLCIIMKVTGFTILKYKYSHGS